MHLERIRRDRSTSPLARPSQRLSKSGIRHKTKARRNNNHNHGEQQELADAAKAPPQWKRVMDIAVVSLSLPIVILLSSWIYLWIKLVSPGKVLFRQTRIGRNENPFTLYKFRSMKNESSTSIHESHIQHLAKGNLPMTKLDFTGDTRLIRGGYLIRILGLDELPQFINILRGDMTLVGPRPCLPSELNLYGVNQHLRFTVKPGITGRWQVNRTTLTTFAEMVEMDDEYVETQSIAEDVIIMIKTPFALMAQMVKNRKSESNQIAKENKHNRPNPFPSSHEHISVSHMPKIRNASAKT